MRGIHDEELVWRKKFGNKLKRLIHKKDMTQGEFAEELGVIDTTISKYITGERMPSPYRIQQIVNVLDCNINDLFDVDN